MPSTEISEIELQMKNLNKVRRFRPQALPHWVLQAILKMTGDIHSKGLYKDALQMARVIEGRKAEITVNKAEDVNEDQSLLSITSKMAMKAEMTRIKRTEKMFKSRDFFVYNEYSSLAYLLSMGIKKFTALSRIFHEIKLKDSEFKPKNLLDVNSGVGSTVWAAHLMWPEHLSQAVHCEDSEYQTKTCQAIHNSNAHIEQFPTIFYRRRTIPNGTFDLIVSAYCLLDQKSNKDLKAHVLQLDNVLSDHGYLVFLEAASADCFKQILSVRSILLRKGYNIFSPCPHSSHCPAFVNHNQTCAFKSDFQNPVLDEDIGAKEENQRLTFTFLVVTKGASKGGENCQSCPTKARLVLGGNESQSGGRINRFLCMPTGQLLHIQPSKKNHSKLYNLLGRMHNQDELPVMMKPTEDVIR